MKPSTRRWNQRKAYLVRLARRRPNEIFFFPLSPTPRASAFFFVPTQCGLCFFVIGGRFCSEWALRKEMNLNLYWYKNSERDWLPRHNTSWLSGLQLYSWWFIHYVPYIITLWEAFFPLPPHLLSLFLADGAANRYPFSQLTRSPLVMSKIEPSRAAFQEAVIPKTVYFESNLATTFYRRAKTGYYCSECRDIVTPP